MTPDISNERFQLATDLILRTSKNIFLTGKAGTGKTTFLKYIREICKKPMAIVAPTGVAAINAGGVTIHSFFQLPLVPFVPESAGADYHDFLSKIRLGRDKIKIMIDLELLIIDEISMVRADVLDAIDTILRLARRNKRPFGGLQVLFIGDMFQLSPVAKDKEWNYLSKIYKSPYFFDSKVLEGKPPLFVEFEKVYRQSNPEFIELLNKVRQNNLNDTDFALLDDRLLPNGKRIDRSGAITLATHNYLAIDINKKELSLVNTPAFTYQAAIDDDFPESAYPAEAVLVLKVGAQVMFLRNDPAKERKYFNGKIGVVEKLERHKVFVRCPDLSDPIEVWPDTWENRRYSLNPSRQLQQTVIGTFSQFPLRLAWAVTIHKSQGLTFDKVIIDAANAFASGQLYVALSRCTSLEGVFLETQINHSGIFTDPTLLRFASRMHSSDVLRKELESARVSYQLEVISRAFEFKFCREKADDLILSINRNQEVLQPESKEWSDELLSSINSISNDCKNFIQWIVAQFADLSAENISKVLGVPLLTHAEKCFVELDSIKRKLLLFPGRTNKRTLAVEIQSRLKSLYLEASLRSHIIKGFESKSFNTEEWHSHRSVYKEPAFEIQLMKDGVAKRIEESPHPDLLILLRKHRDQVCAKTALAPYLVASVETLIHMTNILPLSLEELNNVHGFGPSRVRAFGQAFIDIVKEYCIAHDVKANATLSKGPFVRDKAAGINPGTEESFRLFRKGLSIDKIAETRNLKISTIKDHLVPYVQKHLIRLDEVVDQALIEPISKVLGNNPGQRLKLIKQILGDTVDYSDIRFVQASMELIKENTSVD